MKTLTFRGETVKEFRHAAPNQFRVLDAFEETGWLNTVDDPLLRKEGMNPKRRVTNTVDALNNNHTSNVIFFRTNGKGTGFEWGVILASERDVPQRSD